MEAWPLPHPLCSGFLELFVWGRPRVEFLYTSCFGVLSCICTYRWWHFGRWPGVWENAMLRLAWGAEPGGTGGGAGWGAALQALLPYCGDTLP